MNNKIKVGQIYKCNDRNCKCEGLYKVLNLNVNYSFASVKIIHNFYPNEVNKIVDIRLANFKQFDLIEYSNTSLYKLMESI
jgi:hypothetical protein